MKKLSFTRTEQIDLVHEPIRPALVRLAMPIMASAFMATAYNLTDMAWVGTLGADAVAAVGVGGMYTWLSAGVITLARMGGQVLVGQELGAGRRGKAASYARASVQMGLFLGILYGLAAVLLTRSLVGYFRLSRPDAIAGALLYIRIVCGLVTFFFMSFLLTGLFHAQGDSVTPFRANLMGVIFNMVMDPLLIRGIGPFPKLGVGGAAIATVSAQAIVALLLVRHLLSPAGKENVLRDGFIFRKEKRAVYADIFRLGFPAAVQNMIYTGISFVLGRLVSRWGDYALAAQRMGNQIESVSWNIADGFAAAINAFTAQNFGAKQKARIREGYRFSFLALGAWGLFVTAVFFFCADPISRIFFHEPDVIELSNHYLIIISFCEAFMCIEGMTIGALSGLGKTRLCSRISILLTGARIPYAYLLCRTPLGLNGIWWAYSISSISKGIIFSLVYRNELKKLDF
ncbi:MAG: MATE family efflux transporter [Clostridium sp.]|nr:MATE family efflux transporter [Clostridium sp.]